jgi:hypothetical protein
MIGDGLMVKADRFKIEFTKLMRGESVTHVVFDGVEVGIEFPKGVGSFVVCPVCGCRFIFEFWLCPSCYAYITCGNL